MPDTQKTFLALVKAPAVRNVEISLESSDILDAIYDGQLLTTEVVSL